MTARQSVGVRDCTCPRTRHEHGTRNAYVSDGCRCRPCRDAAAAYERHRARQRAYGRFPYVDATRAREHVLALRAAGMGLKRVAALSGVPHGSLSKLIYGDPQRGMAPSKRILPQTELAVLAVTADGNLASGAKVDATGTVRRLRGLVAAGWTRAELARRLGWEHSNLWALIDGRRPEVTARTAAAVRALAQELWNQTPPASSAALRGAARRVQREAAAKGWAPLLAWDDEPGPHFIDDPTATPVLAPAHIDGLDEAAVERRAAGDRTVTLTNAERREVVRRLHESGLTDRDIERRTGINDRQILRDRRRLGLPANDQRRVPA